MSKQIKYLILIVTLALTSTLLLWPNFHPEQKLLGHYYWQADVLIHSGYFFGITLFILSLRLNIKSIYLFLFLGSFSIVMELLQHFSYKRGVSLMDAMDNLIGIGLALLVYGWIDQKWKTRKI